MSGAAVLTNSLSGGNDVAAKVLDENEALRSENAMLKAKLLQLENGAK